MSIVSEPVEFRILDAIVRAKLAGTTDANSAAALNTAGFTVPRENPVNYRSQRYDHGFIVQADTLPACEQYRWSATSVAAVLADATVADVVAGTASRTALHPSRVLTVT